ncbi:MAG: hypothetical protein HY069_04260 [Chlamydiia bacterium]|nr:hypothetical protein [Chlamydiia bacterium]
MNQAKPASKQLNLNKLSDADGLKSGGCPTPAEPMFESRSVYRCLSEPIALVSSLRCLSLW